MKVTVITKEFITALETMKDVVERRNTMPILSHVKIAFCGATIELSGTDLEISTCLRLRTLATDIGPGCEADMNVADTLKVLKTIKTEMLVIEHNIGNNSVTIHSGKMKLKPKALGIEEMPDMMSKVPGSFGGEIGVKKLLSALESVAPAISKDESRLNLNGAFIEQDDDKGFNVMATDGHRLHLGYVDSPISIPEGSLSTNPGAFILPVKGVKVLIKMIKKYKPESVNLTFDYTEKIGKPLVDGGAERILKSYRFATFAFGHIRLQCRVIDETFPNYRQVIPTGDKVLMSFDRSELSDILKQIIAISPGEERPAVFIARHDYESATLIAGCVTLVDDFRVTFGDDIDKPVSNFITLDAKYVLDYCNVSKSAERIVLAIKDEASAATLTSAPISLSSAVVMPIRPGGDLKDKIATILKGADDSTEGADESAAACQ